MFNLDLLAALPPPRDDEPPSLRSDIVDELLDHLQCAFRREVLKDGDEAAAERRVLDRFGDPRKLARRLWWQAMWSRVMGKRILSGLQWLVSLAAVCLAAGVFWQQSRMLKEMANNQTAENHWRQNLSLTLNELRNRLPVPATDSTNEPEAGGGAGGMFPMGMRGGAAIGEEPATPTLTVKLVQETADGQPVTSMIHEIVLTGASRSFDGVPNAPKGMGGIGSGMPKVSTDGRFMFYDLDPDRYELKITLADGQHCAHPVLIRDDKPQTLTVICPGPRKRVAVHLTAPELPDELKSAYTGFVYRIQEQPIVLGNTRWNAAESFRYETQFNPKTRELMTVNIHRMSEEKGSEKSRKNPEHINFSDVPPKERILFLARGPVNVRMDMSGDNGKPHAFWPQGNNEWATRIVDPDEPEWQLELPEELLQAARSQLQNIENSVAITNEPKSDDILKQISLTVKLVRESADGPPVSEPAKLHLGRVSDQADPLVQPRLINLRDGKYSFLQLPPDRYRLMVALQDGQHCEQSVVIHSGKPRELTLVCPGPREKASVLITVPPLPDDLREAGGRLTYGVKPKPIVLEGTSWLPGETMSNGLSFDPVTGQIVTMSVNGESIDLTNANEDDRTVFLLTGPAFGQFSITGIPLPPIFERPDGKYADDIDRTVQSGENRWEVKPPEELIAKIQDYLKSRSDRGRMFRRGGTDPKTGNTIGVPADAPDEDQPVEANQLENGQCRVTVKLTDENKDGPPAKFAVVTLMNQHGLWERQSRKKFPNRKASADSFAQSFTTQEDGVLKFERLEPGRYMLEIECQNGYRTLVTLPLLRPDEDREEHIVCPSAELVGKKALLAVNVPSIPEDVRQAKCHLTVSLGKKGIQYGDIFWRSPSTGKVILIDQHSGHPSAVVESTGHVDENLGQHPLEDRLIIVPTGDYEVSIQLYKSVPSSNLFGKLVAQQNIKAEYKVDAGDNSWKIEIPDEFWAEAKNKLAEFLTSSESKTGDELPTTPPSNPVDKTPNAKTDPPRKIDAPKLTLIAHSQGKPVADVRVTLYGDDQQGEKVPAVVETGVTNAAGQVQWTNLPVGRYWALIYAPQVEMSTVLSLHWEGIGHEQRVIALPTDVRVTDTVVTTNLPQDLIDAHVKVCLRITSQHQQVGENAWRYMPNLFHLQVVGKAGVEGRIQLPKLGTRSEMLEIFRKLCHRIEPVSESKLKLPVTLIRVDTLDLICPAPATPKDADLKGNDIEWIICAAPQPKRGTTDVFDPPEITFEPKVGETNQWTIQVPDELIAIARSRIAELKLEGKPGGDAPAKNENTDEKPVEKSPDDKDASEN